MKRMKQIWWVLLTFSCMNAWSEQQAETIEPLNITVYRSPTCGCCHKWVDYLKDHQFQVEDIVTDKLADIKDKYAVPQNLASCHTAVINGYVVEGHVPVDAIEKLLKEKPAIAGVAAPGMPIGSPGMEMGDRKDAFQVISYDQQGQLKQYTSYPGNQ